MTDAPADIHIGAPEDTLALAIARHCARLEGVKAVALFGSRAAEAVIDPGADWDFYAFTTLDSHLSKTSRDRLWSAPDSPALGRAIVHEGHNDRFDIPGMHIEVEYVPIAEFQKRIDRVVLNAEVQRDFVDWCVLGACPEAVCADVRICKPISDPEGVIEALKRRVAEYPHAFRLQLVSQALFELRFCLKYMRRAAALQDAAYFHMLLSNFSFVLTRLLFAVNRVYFRGPKRATNALKSLSAAPARCAERLHSFIENGLALERMKAIIDDAKRLVLDTVEIIRREGEEEKGAVERGLWDWPDVEPLP